MKRAKIFHNGGSQVVILPKGFRFHSEEVSIRKEGEAVVLDPILRRTWPKGFFKRICIKDARLGRPPQGEMPPSPAMDFGDE